MNRKELLEEHRIFCGTAFRLMEKKNNDYAGSGGNRPFANFERTELFGICTTAQGLLVRMTDKMSRLATAVGGSRLLVADESFEDTCLDLLNYTVLLHAWNKQERQRLAKELENPKDAECSTEKPKDAECSTENPSPPYGIPKKSYVKAMNPKPGSIV